MKKLMLIAVVVALAFGPSCTAEHSAPAGPGGGNKINPNAFKDLSEHNDVLFNLRLAYNTGNIDELNKLLDDNFTFFFSPTDVQAGNVNVAQWDRASEVAATNVLFGMPGSSLPPGQPPVSDINLTITWNENADTWRAISPPNPQQFPGETWFLLNVDYFLDVVAGETTYTTGNPVKAAFVIREANIGGEMIWRIVSWRDDDTVAVPVLATGATQETTWGQVKAIFGRSAASWPDDM